MPSYAPAKPKPPRKPRPHPFNIDWRVRATDAVVALERVARSALDDHIAHHTTRAAEILKPVANINVDMTNARARLLFQQAEREIRLAFHLVLKKGG